MEKIWQIPLPEGRFALVDEADYHTLSRHRWRLVGCGYAGRHEGKKTLFMHRVILGLEDESVFCDHINGFKLDNRRCNLRVATPVENSRNRRKRRGTSSRFKGVLWHKGLKRWRAEITGPQGRIYLGVFHDEVEAALAYDRAAREIDPQFFALNFPTPDEAPLKLLEPGMEVEWESQAHGNETRKRGVIVEVLPPHQLPDVDALKARGWDTCKLPNLKPRPKHSYLVLVDWAPRRMPRVYWPKAEYLKPLALSDHPPL